MSFGYSAGDFIGGANLAYQLIRVLKDTRGASIEYQEAMLELSAMQQAFFQVSQLSRNPVIPQATINSAAHIVMSAMEIISNFLEQSKEYQKRLGRFIPSNGHQHSMSDAGDSWAKIGWALFKKDELKQLRDSLHSRLSSISLLLSAAAYCNPTPEALAKYQALPTKEEADMAQILTNRTLSLPTAESSTKIPVLASSNNSGKPASKLDTPKAAESGIVESQTTQIPQAPNLNNSNAPTSETTRCTVETTMTGLQPRSSQNETEGPHSLTSGLNSTSSADDMTHSPLISPKEQWTAITTTPLDLDSEEEAPEASKSLQTITNTKARVTNARISNIQRLSSTWITDLTFQGLDTEIIEEIRNILSKGILEIKKELPPIRFKDAVGRKFSFPFHLAATWAGMEDLIKQAFMQVDVLGPHVQEGHYDLIGPNGEIILPSVWERVVEADMAISMAMWPLDKAPTPKHYPLRPPGTSFRTGGNPFGPPLRPMSGIPPPPPLSARPPPSRMPFPPIPPTVHPPPTIIQVGKKKGIGKLVHKWRGWARGHRDSDDEYSSDESSE